MMLVLALMSGMTGSAMPSPQQMNGTSSLGANPASLMRVQIVTPASGSGRSASNDPSNYTVNIRNNGDGNGATSGPAVVLQSGSGIQRMVGDKPGAAERPGIKPDKPAAAPVKTSDPSAPSGGGTLVSARATTSDAGAMPTAAGARPEPMVASKGLDPLVADKGGRGFDSLN